jgi:hypothetical protein
MERDGHGDHRGAQPNRRRRRPAERGQGERDDRRQAIARLVAARWLLGDRLFDPSRRLAKTTAEAYLDVAALIKGDTEALYGQADRFRRIERLWEDPA